MSAEREEHLPACFAHFPGAVLQLSAAGVVLASNGRLERELGREIVGHSFLDLLDAESSRGKWDRMRSLAARGADEGDAVWELILRDRDTLLEPRPFSVMWDAPARRFWLLEHRPDPRLDDLREKATSINSELVNVQRALVKERGRLARALEELEEQYRKAEQLTRTVQAQNEELERSNQALDEFAHAVSHDLKAPLRSISRYAAWLEEGAAGRLGEEGRAQLARLRDRAERMRTMIDGVLAYARAGREHARPETVEVGALLREVLELLDPPEEVRVEVGSAMPTLVTERAALRQVFLNLIGNAIRYARRSDAPRVRVEAREAGGLHEFRVEDNGPGIAPRLQARIWALFHTLEPEERAEGTGIGLALVRKLVEAHGGRAWVESEVGAGATFHFQWPGSTTTVQMRPEESDE
jgi:signal transduction histidine kinase